MIYFPAFLMLVVNALCFFSRVSYTCVPYNPPSECETGRYEISIYEHDYERAPFATVESHCVIDMGNTLRAEVGRFIAYSTSAEETLLSGPIKDVQYFDVQDFMKDNAEVCRY